MELWNLTMTCRVCVAYSVNRKTNGLNEECTDRQKVKYERILDPVVGYQRNSDCDLLWSNSYRILYLDIKS